MTEKVQLHPSSRDIVSTATLQDYKHQLAEVQALLEQAPEEAGLLEMQDNLTDLIKQTEKLSQDDSKSIELSEPDCEVVVEIVGGLQPSSFVLVMKATSVTDSFKGFVDHTKQHLQKCFAKQ